MPSPPTVGSGGCSGGGLLAPRYSRPPPTAAAVPRLRAALRMNSRRVRYRRCGVISLLGGSFGRSFIGVEARSEDSFCKAYGTGSRLDSAQLPVLDVPVLRSLTDADIRAFKAGRVAGHIQPVV